MIVRPMGTNLRDDSILTSDMAEVGRVALQRQTTRWKTEFKREFPTETPSGHKEKSSIIAVPIIDKNGNTRGVVVVESNTPSLPDGQTLAGLAGSIEKIAQRSEHFLTEDA